MVSVRNFTGITQGRPTTMKLCLFGFAFYKSDAGACATLCKQRCVSINLDLSLMDRLRRSKLCQITIIHLLTCLFLIRNRSLKQFLLGSVIICNNYFHWLNKFNRNITEKLRDFLEN